MIHEVRDCYFEAAKLMPSMIAANWNLSEALKAEGRLEAVLKYCEKTLSIDPNFTDAYISMGDYFKDLSNLEQSKLYYTQALQLNPNSAITLYNMGNIHKDTGDIPHAIIYYSKALEIVQWYPEAFCNMVYSKIFICDWENADKNFEELVKYAKYQVENSILPSVQPFHALVYPLAPEDKLVLSKTYAQHISASISRYAYFPKQLFEGKVKIGYVSSDFGDHPLTHLMQGVFGLHDRSIFRVYGFALSKNDGSEYRIKVQQDCDSFFDMSSVFDL